MVKKFLSIMCSLALVLCYSLPVYAAPSELPLAIGNSWIVSDGGGSSNIPYLTPEIIR